MDFVMIALLLFMVVIAYFLGRINERLVWIKWWGWEIENNWTPEIGKLFRRNPASQQDGNIISDILALQGKEYRKP